MSGGVEVHRPRNLDWKRAAALLYGDWGTSKAYVIGLAFVAAGFSSLPIILAVCALTALVGLNYGIICRCFPDGGGVYSAARAQGKLLAVVGALLLVADMTVTASLSGWVAMSYLGIPKAWVVWSTIGVILVVTFLNYYGPKHSGSVAVLLAVPTAIAVVVIILLSIPHLTLANLEKPHDSFSHAWVAFTGVILALSGVEAVANLTGVMKADPGSDPEKPKVGITSTKTILPVAIEVTLGTALLAWAMLSLPKDFAPKLVEHQEDMLRFLAECYGNLSFGPWFGHIFGAIVGVLFALLLLSAVNTAVVALIGLLYMLARDGEIPPSFAKLNKHGVPWLPLAIAAGLPIVVLILCPSVEALAGMYAIGVVGAIALNLGCSAFNRKLDMRLWQRVLMGVTFVILFAVLITLAKTKPDALFFVVCVIGIGLGLRAYSHRVSGLETVTVPRDVAQMVAPETIASFRAAIPEGQKIMVAARGLTPVLKYALDEAELRKAVLCVLYVKEIAVYVPIASSTLQKKPNWQDDPYAANIIGVVLQTGQERNIPIIPLYAVSDDAAGTILDLAATLGVETLMLGGSHRKAMANLLKGNVINSVAQGLPEEIKLVIYG